MRNALLVASVLLIATTSAAQEEEITLTTYYPAPYGDYASIALEPTPTAGAPASPSEGQIYYNVDDDELKIYGEDPSDPGNLVWSGIRSTESPAMTSGGPFNITREPPDLTWFSARYARIGNLQIAWGKCYLWDQAWKTGETIPFPVAFKAGSKPSVTATATRPDTTTYTTAFQIKSISTNQFMVWQSLGLEDDETNTSLYLNWTAIGVWE